MKLGASAYLAHAELAGPTFAEAATAGATRAFTSLHIPEDDPASARSLAASIIESASESGLSVVADVSPRTAELLGPSPWRMLASWGVARARIDFGYSASDIRTIGETLPIALNASTLQPEELEVLSDLDVELIHNFYPREWTGLGLATVTRSIDRAHTFGWRVGAFIAGDALRRDPLGEGLPTLEAHRHAPPAVQAAELVSIGVDDVYVGDPALTSASWARLGALVHDEVIVLEGTAAPGTSPALLDALRMPDRDRPDSAEAMIRLEGSRNRLASLAPDAGGQPRPAGAITVQTTSAGRYRGEASIVLRELPSDDRVAVVGHLSHVPVLPRPVQRTLVIELSDQI